MTQVIHQMIDFNAECQRARDEGYRAFRCNQSENPYVDQDDDLWGAWQDGWQDAAQDAE